MDEWDCAECEYYDDDEGCRAFECIGLECPELPCEVVGHPIISKK